jgi:hypothetical protein
MCCCCCLHAIRTGNILFRSVPRQQQARQLKQLKKQQAAAPKPSQQQRRRGWQFWRRARHSSSSSSSNGGGAAAPADTPAPEQWEVELEQMIAAQQRNWQGRNGGDTNSPSSSHPAAAQGGAASADGGTDDAAASSPSEGPPGAAQLVLLDFGLAEQLTHAVRHHFISFLNAISAGDGLAAARHLLRWSGKQACQVRVLRVCGGFGGEQTPKVAGS